MYYNFLVENTENHDENLIESSVRVEMFLVSSTKIS